MLDTGSVGLAGRKKKKRRGLRQDDGGLSDRQSENSSRSTFHPFRSLAGGVLVCEGEIQSSSFHSSFLSPSTLPYSLEEKNVLCPPPHTHTLTCSSLFLIRLPCLPFFLFLSTPSVTPAMHAHKKTLLRFVGLGHCCLSEHCVILFRL